MYLIKRFYNSAKFTRLLKSREVTKNILFSICVKIISTVVTLSLVPVALSIIEKEYYGVWLTIYSIVNALLVFDLGLSTGLTNKLSEAFARNDIELARKYLATTYFSLLLIVAAIAVLYFFVSPFIPWRRVFNTDMNESTLHLSLNLAFGSFALLFIVKPITALLISRQRHYVFAIVQVVANLTTLLIILSVKKITTLDPFVILTLAAAFTYPLALATYSIYFFTFRHPELFPAARWIDFSKRKELFGIGIKFFIIELTLVSMLSFNNFILSNLLGPESVTDYNVAYRLYSVVSIAQLMFLQPLWPAFTRAYLSKDFIWIKSKIRQMNYLNIALCGVLCFFLAFHQNIFNLWLGGQSNIPFSVNVSLCLYFAIFIFAQTYVYLINGVGALNLQTTYSVVILILHFPFSFVLIRYANLSTVGLVIANVVWISLALMLWRRQYRVLVTSQSKHLIWQ